MKKIFTILLVLLMLCGCEAKQEEVDEVKVLLDSLTVEQKVGQLFFIRPDALSTASTTDQHNSKLKGITSVNEELKYLYEKYPCGGFVIFNKNLEDEQQLKQFTSDLHLLGVVSPLIAIDEEGGLVARIANNENFNVPKFENYEDIAKSGDTNRAYELGYTIGTYLNDFGVDIDFAPVADVNTNPLNPVIGVRAFGDDPKVAGEMVKEVVKGLHDSNTYSCLKHFPGHGDTNTDTHTGYAETLKTWDELLNCEMIPFIAGIDEGSDLIMSAHIATPTITSNNEPSTLNYEILTNKLRNELGFNGVIVTDSLAMEAISKVYSSSEAAIKAFLAGSDIILMPEDYFEAYTGFLEAVNNGTIPMDRLDESVYRILKLKLNNK